MRWKPLHLRVSAIEERYWWWVKHPHDPKLRTDAVRRAADRRKLDRKAGRPVFYPVRYADDFLIFVSGSYEDAVAERQALGDWLREEMGLTLSEEKTRITKLTEGFRFLGCRVRLKWDDDMASDAASRSPRRWSTTSAGGSRQC